MQPLPHTTNALGTGRATLAREVLDAVPPVIWFVRRQMRAHRKGLSLPAFRALVRIDQCPNTSLSAVAEHLGASLPTASRIVAGLVAKEFLTRCDCDGDRRQLSLCITPRGRAVLDAAWSGTQTRLEAELTRLSAPQRAVVEEAMGILKTLFGTTGLPDPAETPGMTEVR